MNKIYIFFLAVGLMAAGSVMAMDRAVDHDEVDDIPLFFGNPNNPEDIDAFHKISTNKSNTNGSHQADNAQELEIKIKDAKNRLLILIAQCAFSDQQRGQELGVQFSQISRSNTNPQQKLQAYEQFEKQNFLQDIKTDEVGTNLDNGLSKTVSTPDKEPKVQNPADPQPKNDMSKSRFTIAPRFFIIAGAVVVIAGMIYRYFKLENDEQLYRGEGDQDQQEAAEVTA